MERKLAAIFSADVKGYSRLMGEDEEATVRTLTAYRDVMTDLIEQRRGRVVDSPGDNLLAEFASAVDAVQCAVTIQRELTARNAALPDHRKMEFRIGINLGDVIVEGERLYGDGVNIAARIEGLTEAGGVCLAGTVYDQVKNKLPLEYIFLGEHTVKNITEPIRVYRVQRESETSTPKTILAQKLRTPRWQWAAWAAAVAILVGAAVMALRWWSSRSLVEVASESSITLTLPDRPSIAVLPFANMSHNPEQEYFSDGITEDIITTLSKSADLFVIARHSTFTYKGKSVTVQQVGRELGVRYVLEGSIQRDADRVRITAQLVDATTGYHLWAERYDRELRDVFALQDEITQQIVASLTGKLTSSEPELTERQETANLEAYDHVLRGWEYFWRTTQEANEQARQMFEHAVTLDPQYAEAHAGLGFTYFLAWAMQWDQMPQTLEQALGLAHQAIALDDTLPAAYNLLAQVSLWQKQHEQAIAAAEHAIARDPNYAEGYSTLGEILIFSGRPGEAIGWIEKAMRLDPRYPFSYLHDIGHAYYLLGRYEEAMAILKRVLIRNPDWMPSHAYLAAIYSELGQKEKARAEAAEIRRLSPQLSPEQTRQRLPYKDQAVLERFLDALHQVGE